TALNWGMNPNDETLYAEVTRAAQQNPAATAHYVIMIDTDNDGRYGENVDRVAIVTYTPGQLVQVQIRRGTINGMVLSETSGMWGDSVAAGGRRVEFG